MLSIGPSSIISAVAQGGSGDGVQSASAAQYQTVSDLPTAAQHAISSAIGQDQSAYHATSGAAGVSLDNPANGFAAEVQSGTLRISAGLDTWNMSLAGLGYGGAVQPVGIAQTSANGNRVDCNYGTIDEWYVNGPGGLEQGFNVAPECATGSASALLTLELALGGDLRAAPNAAGDGVTLIRPDGSTALGYTGLTAYDATGKTLPASLKVRTDGDREDLLIGVNAAGAHGQITIDPFLQEANLTSSDPGVGDFGRSVAIGSGTIAVGASGVAYVFVEPASGWADMTETAKLTAADGTANDSFGSSVAITGDSVVVGAPFATVSGNAGQGAAYVFTEPDSGWADMNQTAKLTAADGAANDHFGTSVAIDGNTVVVGANWANGHAGVAYMFTKPGSSWTGVAQTAKLTGSDVNGGAWFGTSVSISGNTVAVGAPYAADATSGDPKGAVYVFTNAVQAAKFTASDPWAGEQFGWSVSISGSTIVVGAPQAYVMVGDYNVMQGAAFVFAGMTQAAKLTASDGIANDRFGASVSIDGNTVMVGAAKEGNNVPGAAYVFTGPDSGWANMTETGKLAVSRGPGNDLFGTSVAVDGNTVVGSSAFAGVFLFGAGPISQVASISPSSGPLAGGTRVSITGTNLADATRVNFGTTAGTILFASDTQIIAISPAESVGTVDVTVVTAGGTSATSAADQFTYTDVPTPIVSAVAPSAGPLAGGALVTITGANLAEATAVNFGTTAALGTIFSDTDTQIVVASPSESTGTVDVTVTTAGGTSATSTADQFTYTAAPIVLAVVPSVGPLAGGTTVTITGMNLTGATAVNFGAVAGTIVTDIDNLIVATSPPGSVGTVDVTVVTPGGTSATSAADQFNYTTAPIVSKFSCSAGPVAGGTTVTITGTNLAKAAKVLFGTKAAKIKSDTDTQIVVVSPAGKGTVDVIVLTANGASAVSATDKFSYLAAPTVTKISPAAGSTSGGTSVTITGANLADIVAVMFGKVKATAFSGNSIGQIVANRPAGTAGTVDVTVVTAGGTSKVSAADKFAYVAAPGTPTGLSASATGPQAIAVSWNAVSGATDYLLYHWASPNGPWVKVYYGSNKRYADSGSQMQPNTTYYYEVCDWNAAGYSAFTPYVSATTWVAAPTVTAVNPPSGPPGGGTTVTITGTDLAGATAVHFGKVLARIRSAAATQIVVVSPAGKAGTVDVTVTTPGGTSALTPNDKFTYGAAGASGLPAPVASAGTSSAATATPAALDAALLAALDDAGPTNKNRRQVDPWLP